MPASKEGQRGFAGNRRVPHRSSRDCRWTNPRPRGRQRAEVAARVLSDGGGRVPKLLLREGVAKTDLLPTLWRATVPHRLSRGPLRPQPVVGVVEQRLLRANTGRANSGRGPPLVPQRGPPGVPSVACSGHSRELGELTGKSVVFWTGELTGSRTGYGHSRELKRRN